MLSLTDIEKAYGATRAVKAVTLNAAPGTVLGLAGENGAGKSTVIKILAGAVVPDAGKIDNAGYLTVRLSFDSDTLLHRQIERSGCGGIA